MPYLNRKQATSISQVDDILSESDKLTQKFHSIFPKFNPDKYKMTSPAHSHQSYRLSSSSESQSHRWYIYWYNLLRYVCTRSQFGGSLFLFFVEQAEHAIVIFLVFWFVYSVGVHCPVEQSLVDLAVGSADGWGEGVIVVFEGLYQTDWFVSQLSEQICLSFFNKLERSWI